jgi:hypothetical protein
VPGEYRPHRVACSAGVPRPQEGQHRTAFGDRDLGRGLQGEHGLVQERRGERGGDRHVLGLEAALAGPGDRDGQGRGRAAAAAQRQRAEGGRGEQQHGGAAGQQRGDQREHGRGGQVP